MDIEELLYTYPVTPVQTLAVLGPIIRAAEHTNNSISEWTSEILADIGN